eukprot:1150907-Pelagomonas_calceolata.AAC.4
MSCHDDACPELNGVSVVEADLVWGAQQTPAAYWIWIALLPPIEQKCTMRHVHRKKHHSS